MGGLPSTVTVLVPLFDLKFLTEFAAAGVGCFMRSNAAAMPDGPTDLSRHGLGPAKQIGLQRSRSES